MLSDHFFSHRTGLMFSLLIIVCFISSCANLTPMEKSIDTLTSEADEGDLNAAHALCFRFSNGIGVEVNDDAAFNWCNRASSTQNPKSMTLLADLYYQGRGTQQDYHQAAKLYYFAAQRGIDKAMLMLYHHYINGYGVAKDETEARYYLNRAAQRNYAPAKQLKQQLLLQP